MTDSHEPFQENDLHESGLRHNKADGQSPGEMLRDGRRAHDYSVEDLCAQTKLSPKTVKALEDNDFEALSQPVFARGYYRQCAKVLDLDAERLMRAYSVWAGEPPVKSQRSRGLLESPAPAPKPKSADVIRQQVAPRRRSRSRGLFLWLIVIAIAVAVAAVVLLPRLASNLSANNSQQSDTQILSGQGSTDTPVATNDAPSADANDASSAGANDQSGVQGSSADTTADNQGDLKTVDTPPSAGAADQPPTTGNKPGGRNVNHALGISPSGQQNPQDQKPDQKTAAGSAEQQSSSVAPNQLKLTFSKRSWVRVTDANGNRLASGIFEAGDTKAFDGKPPYNVTLGFAPGVAVSIGGKPVDVASQTNGSIAHLKINAPGDNG
ncbi:MAG: DUF4115 domain-containing protein [Salinisphaera sp.]|jgi:cytoskeleton protein RodZ|nr:DUF4115 domain-containing protein [Salinisphaera sp.]